MRNLLRKNELGQSLIELLIVIGLASIMLPAVFVAVMSSQEGRIQQKSRMEALSLLREAQDATRSYRDHDWDKFAVDGTFKPVVSNNAWILSPISQPEVVNGFQRQIVINDVYRDSNGSIVLTGGTIDLSIKKITATVSWGTSPTTSVQSIFYLTRHTNLSNVQTTYDNFNNGSTKTGTIVTNQFGGEVTLGGGGGATDWCSPNLSLAAVNLDGNGVANAISAIEGRVFVGTGNNASGPTFDNVTIGLDYPPTAQISGSYNTPIKTNGVFGETNYAYVATDTNGKQGDILDLTQKDTNGYYKETGWLNTQVSNSNGQSVFVTNNIAYLSATNDKIYSFDVTSKSGAHTPLANIDLGATANKIIVVGSNIYAALNSSSNQLVIIPIVNNGTSFGSAVKISVNGSTGRDVFVNSTGTRAYVATAFSSSKKEVFVVNVDTTSPDYGKTLSSYSTHDSVGSNGDMDPYGITVVRGPKIIVVGHGGLEYQVVDASNENSLPTNPCGSLNIDSGINGISSVTQSNNYAYSYIITGDSSSELKIIEGGPGGAIAMSGIFESGIFSASKSSTFNSFFTTYATPGSATIKFQVAITGTNATNCATVAYSYVGPDKTSGSYFATSSAALPIASTSSYMNPGKCFRYKAFLTGNDVDTPYLYDFTINYSP